MSLLKSELYGWLKMSRPTDEELANGKPYPTGYCHFPEYDAEFFRMLTTEQLVKRTVKGYPKLEWEKNRERNEALDARIYARAAAIAIGADRWSPDQWAELEEHVRGAEEPAAAAEGSSPARQAPSRRASSRVVRSSWADRVR